MPAPTLLWLRRDLRLADQPALRAAIAAGGPVIPVYVLDDETPKHRRMGAASRWWLHHSLHALAADLRGKGSRLILRRGRSDAVLAQLAAETGAGAVHALAHHEPWWRNAESATAKRLRLHLHDGNYLAPPGTVLTGAGTPYKIYTPFWRALTERMPPAEPLPAPASIPAPEGWPESDTLADWALLPTRPNWAAGFEAEWTAGEDAARDRLDEFAADVSGPVAAYDSRRNLPSVEGTSRLSPHLHFGEISPATVWHRIAGTARAVTSGTSTFLGELGWRDYAQNVILQLPDYGRTNGRAPYDALPWRSGAQAANELAAWQQGRTGYPIVDAGMRQLWATGWMHNRVRMIVASFLVKHLLIDWRAGEQWFWDTLVDADYAQNAVNWQWSAGTGVDANMFVRIMAPLTQSAKFDAGAYIRRWVPELAGLDDVSIHDPVRRPNGYPVPIVGHAEGRARALAAHSEIKGRM
ncbi:MAG: DNA photolyase family protein [Sphingomonadales bacterium]|nr:DNA photolyase family protein [Sphingomonadales bacterium]